jgi:6,7-dimethyl-8-ribityllumazine synthase
MPSRGRPKPPGAPPRAHVAVVAARWNESVVEKLLDAAVRTLVAAGATHELFRVPGSFELPQVARRLARTGRFAAIVPLGCVIRGDTPHFEYVARAVTDGLLRVSLEDDVPTVFGVLTCDTLAQALDRAGGAEGNKGADAAAAALELVALGQSLAARTANTSRRTR